MSSHDGRHPLDVVKAILADPTDREAVRRRVAADATYVSLNFDNPELKAIMHCHSGNCS